VNQLPFDVSYEIDPETLREVPNDPDDMRRAVAHLRDELDRVDLSAIQRLRIYGQLGSFARITGDLDTAQVALERAVQLSETLGNPRAIFVNRIRLAHVYQWQQRYAESNAIFDQLLEAPDPNYADFLYQHAGKNAFDQGHCLKAINLFEKALELRKRQNIAVLIESSQLALDAAHNRMGNAG
jgi:tetratricopeptide (TPR) repeat protein